MGNADSVGGRLLIVFDGECGFCNGTVRWLLRRDRKDRLRFIAFQSEKAVGILARHGIGPPEPGGGSVLVVRGFGESTESALTRSEAVVAMLKELPGIWPSVARGMRLVPRGMRDWVYGVVARWRRRISGRIISCPVPTAEERERFL